MTVYGDYRYFDSGNGWWRTKVDYSGSSATVGIEVKSGYTVWVRITGTVNGVSNSSLSYSSSATSSATIGTVTIPTTSQSTIALTCSGGSWGQNGTSTAYLTDAYFNLNVLLPDGSEPYSTGTAGSIEMSTNGGASYTRVYNESVMQYPIGTVFRFRNFIPGTGYGLEYVSGVDNIEPGYLWGGTLTTSGMTVTIQTTTNYSVIFHMNGKGGENPWPEMLTPGNSYTISSTVPTHDVLWNFLGWECDGTVYQPGDTITPTKSMTFYAQWSQPTMTGNGTYTANIVRDGMYFYAKFVPSTTGFYGITSTASTASSSDTYGYVYDSSGSQLEYDDDDGDGNHFLIAREFIAGTTYYIGSRYYSSSYTGDITIKIAPAYVIKKINGSSTTTVYKMEDVSVSLGTVSKSATTLATWTLNLNGNGATNSTKTTSYKQYWSFKEWNTAEDGSGTAVSSTYTTNANLTVYAQFKENYRQANSITMSDLSWDGHHFLGWGDHKFDFSGATSLKSYTPTSNNETLYAIWYVPKSYVKTEEGWKLGRTYLKTEDGWKGNELLHIKTNEGWKTGKIYTRNNIKVIAGPFTASANSVYRACYNNRARFAWEARMCYESSSVSTDEVLCQFIPSSASYEQYGYTLKINRATGVLKMSNGSTTTTYNLSALGIGADDFFDIKFIAAYNWTGSTSYYVYLVINGAQVASLYATNYYTSIMKPIFGNAGTYFTSMSFNTYYGSGSFNLSSVNIGDTVTINTAATPATVTTKEERELF